MAEMVIRPTLKFIYAGYTIVLLSVVAAAVTAIHMELPSWIVMAPVLLLLWPLKCHVQNRLTRMTILNGKLLYETGLLSKTTRTILISRVQDLTVHQSVGQRLFAVGDLSIETAGETSRLTIFSIDRPQEIADRINEAAKGPGK